MRAGGGIHCELIPGTFRPLANKDNDYLIDRAAQKARRTFSGVKGISMQDASIQESAGADPGPHEGEPGVDRQRHHHGAPSPDEGRAQPGEAGAAGTRSCHPARALGVAAAAARRRVRGRRARSADRACRTRVPSASDRPPCAARRCASAGTAQRLLHPDNDIFPEEDHEHPEHVARRSPARWRWASRSARLRRRCASAPPTAAATHRSSSPMPRVTSRPKGIDVEFTSFDSAAKMIAPLGTGQLEVGAGSPTAGFYNAVARGLDVRMVADKGSMPPGYGYLGADDPQGPRRQRQGERHRRSQGREDRAARAGHQHRCDAQRGAQEGRPQVDGRRGHVHGLSAARRSRCRTRRSTRASPPSLPRRAPSRWAPRCAT